MHEAKYLSAWQQQVLGTNAIRLLLCLLRACLTVSLSAECQQSHGKTCGAVNSCVIFFTAVCAASNLDIC